MNKDREKAILELILKNKKVSVKELASCLYASQPSIRRDLQSLEQQQLIRRVHGGAVLEEHSASISRIPFLLREMENSDAKLMMARRAMEYVKDGDVIFLDASSSAYALVAFLAAKSNLTVITSGVKTLAALGDYGINAYSTGGQLLATCQSLVGQDACATIERYNADLFFFSCRGISEDGMATDFSIEENLVRQAMMRRSARSILLCAKEKIGKTYMHNLCHLDQVQLISE